MVNSTSDKKTTATLNTRLSRREMEDRHALASSTQKEVSKFGRQDNEIESSENDSKKNHETKEDDQSDNAFEYRPLTSQKKELQRNSTKLTAYAMVCDRFGVS